MLLIMPGTGASTLQHTSPGSCRLPGKCIGGEVNTEKKGPGFEEPVLRRAFTGTLMLVGD